MVDDKAWEISFQHTSWISIPILWKRMKYFLQTVIMKVKTHQEAKIDSIAVSLFTNIETAATIPE